MNNHAYLDGYLHKEGASFWNLQQSRFGIAGELGRRVTQPFRREPFRGRTPGQVQRDIGGVGNRTGMDVRGSGGKAQYWDGRSRQSHMNELNQARQKRDQYYAKAPVPQSWQGREQEYRRRLQDSYQQRMARAKRQSDPYKTHTGERSQAQMRMDAHNRRVQANKRLQQAHRDFDRLPKYEKLNQEFRDMQAQYKQQLVQQYKAGKIDKPQAQRMWRNQLNKWKASKQFRGADQWARKVYARSRASQAQQPPQQPQQPAPRPAAPAPQARPTPTAAPMPAPRKRVIPQAARPGPVPSAVRPPAPSAGARGIAALPTQRPTTMTPRSALRGPRPSTAGDIQPRYRRW